MEAYLNGADRSQLDPALDLCVEEYLKLDEDGQVEFKSSAKAFTRLYAFLSQVLPYGNAKWEKLPIFLSFLVNKLPAPVEEDLSRGVLDAVDMENYRMERRAAQSISLAEEDAEIAPVPATAANGAQEPEMDRLSNIIAEFNKTWGGKFSDSKRVEEILSKIPEQVLEDQQYRNARMNSGRQKRPDRTGFRPQKAHHLNGEVPDGTLQGLHGGRGVPGLAQKGDVPSDVPELGIADLL